MNEPNEFAMSSLEKLHEKVKVLEAALILISDGLYREYNEDEDYSHACLIAEKALSQLKDKP